MDVRHSMTSPIETGLNDAIPEVSFEITVTHVVANPRKLKSVWGQERRFIDVVERLAAIEAGLPDPGEWEVLGPDPADQLRSLWGSDVEADLVEQAAQEINDATSAP